MTHVILAYTVIIGLRGRHRHPAPGRPEVYPSRRRVVSSVASDRRRSQSAARRIPGRRDRVCGNARTRACQSPWHGLGGPLRALIGTQAGTARRRCRARAAALRPTVAQPSCQWSWHVTAGVREHCGGSEFRTQCRRPASSALKSGCHGLGASG
jgi:hypothetical protein